MNLLRFCTLISLGLIGCTTISDNSDAGACGFSESADITDATSRQTIRGALLGTRYESFEALKSDIRVEYGTGSVVAGDRRPKADVVRVSHCSNGKEVVSVLTPGVHQGHFLLARYDGNLWDRLALPFYSPYAVMNRKDMESIYILTRRRFIRFGEGDFAFFDFAKCMVENINTPDLAFKNARDTTEKGYLNSFNHITIQAFITSSFSEEMADFIADTHERYFHPELITGNFKKEQIADLENGPLDNYVDMINNEWGQELGKQLRVKYGINRDTYWTPALLADYLNDVQSYLGWAFQIGFEPFRPDDRKIIRFTFKINAVMRGW